MSIETNKLLSVIEVAERLEVSRVRVNQLIAAGTLPAEKVGRSYVVKESDVEMLRSMNRTAGRPPKTVNGNGAAKVKTIFDVVPQLVGKHDSGISDLGSNKKHLEGFGRD